MPRLRKIIVIAQERPFDEEKWKRLLTAFAYVLHEQRKAHGQTPPEPSLPDARDAHDASDSAISATPHEAAS